MFGCVLCWLCAAAAVRLTNQEHSSASAQDRQDAEVMFMCVSTRVPCGQSREREREQTEGVCVCVCVCVCV